jgi:predicted  nucleic acid-binding Zn-ribbon protein
MRRMFKFPGESTSLAALREQSAALNLHARRLRQEFTKLREASKVLRVESMQLQEDVRVIRKSIFVQFAELD